MVFNPQKTSQNVTRTFEAQPQSVQPTRVAFLTTGATASASEININSMAPWVEAAIVRDDTLGKPVGQDAFDLSGCEDRLQLVTFKNENALGQGDFYDGLAQTLQFACAAPDTLDKPLGDATEGMTAAALDWIQTGRCDSLIPQGTAARARSGGLGVPDRHPRPRNPSAAQYWLPGVS